MVSATAESHRPPLSRMAMLCLRTPSRFFFSPASHALLVAQGSPANHCERAFFGAYPGLCTPLRCSSYCGALLRPASALCVHAGAFNAHQLSLMTVSVPLGVIEDLRPRLELVLLLPTVLSASVDILVAGRIKLATSFGRNHRREDLPDRCLQDTLQVLIDYSIRLAPFPSKA